MCEPTTLAMAALSAASSASAISNQNKAAVSNAENAKQAANDQYASSTQGYIEQNRSLLQGSFDAILQGRANEAMAYTSAIENGAQGASVKSTLRSMRQNTNRTLTRTGQEMKSLGDQAALNLRGIQANTQGRINSVSTSRWTLGDTAGVLAPIVKAEME